MNKVKYKDITAFHPGYYIEQIIEDMEITQEEFAALTGMSTEIVNLLVRGEIDISKDIAEKLSYIYGMSVDVWLNIQSEYNRKLLKIQNKMQNNR